jgi:RNA polymerase sigma factor (sigma-70 family)
LKLVACSFLPLLHETTIFVKLAFLRNISNDPRADKELVLHYKQTGSMDLLAVLYQRYMDLVYGVCLKYLKDGEKAKDATMTIFEELVEKLKKHDVEHFKSWLYMLSKNHCLMQLRTPKNLKTTEFKTELMQSEEDLHLNGVMEKEAHLVQMEKCMETLVAEQRESIRLFYLEQKCYKEIADITGQDWNKIRSFIQNGRRNLKLCMDKNG